MILVYFLIGGLLPLVIFMNLPRRFTIKMSLIIAWGVGVPLACVITVALNYFVNY